MMDFLEVRGLFYFAALQFDTLTRCISFTHHMAKISPSPLTAHFAVCCALSYSDMACLLSSRLSVNSTGRARSFLATHPSLSSPRARLKQKFYAAIPLPPFCPFFSELSILYGTPCIVRSPLPRFRLRLDPPSFAPRPVTSSFPSSVLVPFVRWKFPQSKVLRRVRHGIARGGGADASESRSAWRTREGEVREEGSGKPSHTYF